MTSATTTTTTAARTLVEICLEDVGGAATASGGGADAIEVCAGLADGGTTPTLGFVRHCAAHALDMEVRVLVRVRPGDFVHSVEEVEVMVGDIEAVRDDLPSTTRLGFAIGTLRPDGAVDEDAVRRLVDAAGGAPVTFHKAFDVVPDKVAALRRLADLGVTRVLTAGGSGPAVDHLTVLAELVRRSPDGVRIAVGGGVRPGNVAAIVAETGATEVHLRAPGIVPPAVGAMAVDQVFGSRGVTSAAVVADVLAALGR